MKLTAHQIKDNKDLYILRDENLISVGTLRTTNNCKLCIFEGCSSEVLKALATGTLEAPIRGSEEDYTTVIGSRTVFVHITHNTIAEILRNSPHLIYENVVPIGYGAGKQYHILMNWHLEDSYTQRIRKEEGIVFNSPYAKNAPKIDVNELKAESEREGYAKGVAATYAIVKEYFAKKYKLRETLKTRLFDALNKL